MIWEWDFLKSQCRRVPNVAKFVELATAIGWGGTSSTWTGGAVKSPQLRLRSTYRPSRPNMIKVAYGPVGGTAR